MVIELDLSEDELSRLKSLTRVTSDSEAVSCAAREFLRIRQLRELKAASGQVDFDLDWQELEQMELGDLGFPQA